MLSPAPFVAGAKAPGPLSALTAQGAKRPLRFPSALFASYVRRGAPAVCTRIILLVPWMILRRHCLEVAPSAHAGRKSPGPPGQRPAIRQRPGSIFRGRLRWLRRSRRTALVLAGAAAPSRYACASFRTRPRVIRISARTSSDGDEALTESSCGVPTASRRYANSPASPGVEPTRCRKRAQNIGRGHRTHWSLMVINHDEVLSAGTDLTAYGLRQGR